MINAWVTSGLMFIHYYIVATLDLYRFTKLMVLIIISSKCLIFLAQSEIVVAPLLVLFL